ncbi:hypothetical protein BN1723_009678 [Verticillium longisporum]|uniref:Uncharacterized protein n=1 Tax=Verticillium longisporum TaxID=100787 RepID=A0A0G4KR98_VERLO|nr:hypothetical protein BN1723_009678 [Verticillium longisporum]
MASGHMLNAKLCGLEIYKSPAANVSPVSLATLDRMSSRSLDLDRKSTGMDTDTRHAGLCPSQTRQKEEEGKRRTGHKSGDWTALYIVCRYPPDHSPL